MNNGCIYFIQILFVTGIAIGSQVLNLEDKQKWLNVARYSVYLLTIRLVPAVCYVLGRLQATRPDLRELVRAATGARGYALVFLGCAAALLLSEERLYTQDFVFLFLGYLLAKYPGMGETAPPGAGGKTAVSYGAGMACSYFEGYLVHILPSDGAKFVGFEENMRALEDREGILFPVKKMFIIITKSMYSPPDLKQFNRAGPQLPYLEAFNSLADVKKSVAGVRNRIYRNTAYKIYRPPASPPGASPPAPPPVCLAAECATPLHTLYKVINNRALYDVMADIDVEEVVSDFCSTLRTILEKSPECRGKCELVYYDHDDPSQNLSQILLHRIRELAPDFEQQIVARRDENIILQNAATLELH